MGGKELKTAEGMTEIEEKMTGRAAESEGRMTGRAAESEGRMMGRAAESEGKMAGRAAESEGRMTGRAAEAEEKMARRISEMEEVISGRNLYKKYKGFELSVPQFGIPKGFATALIGENGAGKTTLLNILAGIRLDFKGEISYFGCEGNHTDSNKQKRGEQKHNARERNMQEHNAQKRNVQERNVQERNVQERNVQERIGYTGPGCYFLPQWTIGQVEEVGELLFDHFDKDRFRVICRELGIEGSRSKEVKKLSDGNKMKLMLASALARETELLILDEPASPLDPLMRDKLCDIIRNYLEQGNGERSVFFSTHNIADMENVTDYAIILEHGNIVEAGFVESLKEKYLLVKGEAADAERAKEVLFSMTRNAYGFEGICLAQKLEQLAGMDIAVEVPTLSQISVAVMKANTKLKFS